jgi:aspartate kinase
MKVYKFGGGVLDSANAIENLVKIVSKHSPSVVVVSAMGKTTNQLENIYSQILASKSCDSLVKLLFSYYEHIASKLFDDYCEAQILIEYYRKSLLSVISQISSNRNEESLYSSIVALGELMTSQLITLCLSKQSDRIIWIDARTSIKTLSGYTNAEIDWELTQQSITDKIYPLLQSGNIIVTQGFIASNNDGETTTLGREGSDYTATIIASCISAQSVTLYKNVPGVMTANPRLFKNSEKLDCISYDCLKLITDYGSQIVHHKTINPLIENKIDLYIKNFYKEEESSLITNISQEYSKSIILVDHKCLFVSINSDSDKSKKKMTEISNFLINYKAKILISNYGIGLKLCITTTYQHQYEQLMQDLNASFDIKEMDYAYIISLLFAKNYERFFTKRPKPLMWHYDKVACQVVVRSTDIEDYATQLCMKTDE